MKVSDRRIRRALLLSVSAVIVAAMAAFGVASSAVGAQGASHARADQPIGPGYPPPGGIYFPFTNCPLLNPLMQESVNVAGCVAGDAVSGTIKIGNLTTAVVHPVNAQFGLVGVPNASPYQFSGGTLPPPAGVSAELTSSPEFVPGGLRQALGCTTATNPVIKKLCSEAKYYGGSYLDVYALAQEALPVTNFQVTTWTQPIMIQLINPLLGPNCYIGSQDNPIVINPQLTGTINVETDPNPTKHPNTVVLEVSGATASDNTFTAPEVTGCGPGGSANIPIDEQLDSYAGVPSASGNNSLSLSGNFYLADCYNSTNEAKILLSAFKASVGTPPVGGAREDVGRLSPNSLLGRFGLK